MFLVHQGDGGSPGPLGKQILSPLSGHRGRGEADVSVHSQHTVQFGNWEEMSSGDHESAFWHEPAPSQQRHRS